MHTGDLATIDAEGYCNIVGRVKDMLIRGGENVYPREIEEFLCAIPRSRPCRCSACPTRSYGEEVCAWIVLKAGAVRKRRGDPRLLRRARSRTYKVPRHVRFVPDFPITATGKPQKFVMREPMMRELGVAEQKTA